MASLHQLQLFLATYAAGSLTGAADELGMAQPSVSEQIRLLERSVGAQLFRRVGRGVVPTEAAEALRPHAEQALGAVAAGQRAVGAVTGITAGTIRFGLFGSARLYLGAQLVRDVMTRHPGVRVELVGQNSSEVQQHLVRGYVEAALIAIPVSAERMTVRPVARDELVYLSADPSRLVKPVTGATLAKADLVMPETTYRDEDSSRRLLREFVQRTGNTLQTRIEVEDAETAVEIVAHGLADSVLPLGAAKQLLPRLAPRAGWVALRPRIHDVFALVHRRDAMLSPAAQSVIELATKRIRSIAEPVH
jgi:DNA-binding transcriptional LysR family regulator